jgi:hypothetical protein
MKAIILIRQMLFEMRMLILQRVKFMWSINEILTKKRSTAVEICAKHYYKAGLKW